MNSKTLLAITMALSMGAAVNAHAINVFDASGVEAFDWTPGNSLADGALPLSNDSTNKTSFTLYSQASLRQRRKTVENQELFYFTFYSDQVQDYKNYR